MKPRIIISGGHWDNPKTPWIEDPGCSFGEYYEFDICQKIRNEFLKLYPEVIPVPSNMSLRAKIDFINSFVRPDDIVIEIHLNYSQNLNLSGCEVYFSDNPYLATIFSRNVAKSLEIPDRGAIHDSKTYVGSLGWLRQIKSNNCVLIEVCYLSNSSDRIKIIMPSGQMKAALGIKKAIDEHFGNLSILEQLKNIYMRLLKIINDKKL